MVGWAKEITESTRLRWNRVYKFKPKIGLSIDFGSYVLKTASSSEELIESFRLRHEVFFQEFQEIEGAGLDVDRFDSKFDHLIILHKESKKIIGTYRVSCSVFSKLSYTELEFDLTKIFEMKGPHLELGRACIHKNHRRGAVISLLWRGIAEYMIASDSNILFGCSSIKIDNPREAALIYKYLTEQGSLIRGQIAKPTKNYEMPDFKAWASYFQNDLTLFQREEAANLIPSLLSSYLKLGAKIAGEPAFDKDFDCIDLLTVLKRDELSHSLARRFQVVR